ncbi:MAG: hypothetical protein AVDCRST_MAG76-474 [uncultured Acidimicrobiales bacterium]|uniref:Uncharacterized protein n=1 Tax=uncultured Acidimicrobiales bacterium TaxID=310071 RepID=A0A6J4H934_9ACTN|nr:MAG: hypothetical protein AVDCRST_MAG76-474 [uncultured Acidimicrobiales bacterium]
MVVALARSFAGPPGDDGDGRAAGVRALAERVAPTTLARERTLPVLPALTGLVGASLRRGGTVTVAGEAGLGATSLAFALVAAATSAGSWAAVAGLPAAHAPSAAHLGVTLGRLALVPDAATLGHWPTVVAALLDGVDLVVAAVPPGLRAPDARRLGARARERGSVLIPLLPAGASWVEGADVRLRVTAATWHGVEAGHGFLQAREVEVAATGRGAAGRERSVRLWLPGHDGVSVVEQAASSTAASEQPAGRSPRVPRSVPSSDQKWALSRAVTGGAADGVGG